MTEPHTPPQLDSRPDNQADTQADTRPLATFVSQLHIAPRQVYKSLTVWPLIRQRDSGANDALPYAALRSAFAAGTLQIDEVDAGGSVPHVRVTNKGNTAVLFLFGEEIRGAKQNRVANASFLVPAKSETVIDVSCVEAGRWSRTRGAQFESSEDLLAPSLRRSMASRVSESRSRGGAFAAGQSEVWQEIGERIAFSGAQSETNAYADYRESRASDLDTMTQAFHPVSNQVGFIACIGDEVAGFEAIGRPDVFATNFPALLRAYAIDAVDAALVKQLDRRPGNRRRFTAPEPFLAELEAAHCNRGRSLGLGEDLRFESAHVGGCALAHRELVHATAFPA
jgi:hypothetical protein